MSVPVGFEALWVEGGEFLTVIVESPEPMSLGSAQMYLGSDPMGMRLLGDGVAQTLYVPSTEGPPSVPAAPSINFLTPGISPRQIIGTAIPGAKVEVTAGGLVFIVTADQVGGWQIVFNSGGVPGTYTLRARQQRAAEDWWSEYTTTVNFLIHADVGVAPGGLGLTGRHRRRKKDEEKPREIIRIPGMAGWTGLAASRRLFPSTKGKKWPGE